MSTTKELVKLLVWPSGLFVALVVVVGVTAVVWLMMTGSLETALDWGGILLAIIVGGLLLITGLWRLWLDPFGPLLRHRRERRSGRS